MGSGMAWKVIFGALAAMALSSLAEPGSARASFWWIEASPSLPDPAFGGPFGVRDGDESLCCLPRPNAKSRHGRDQFLTHPGDRAARSDIGAERAGPWWWADAAGAEDPERPLAAVPVGSSLWFLFSAVLVCVAVSRPKPDLRNRRP